MATRLTLGDVEVVQDLPKAVVSESTAKFDRIAASLSEGILIATAQNWDGIFAESSVETIDFFQHPHPRDVYEIHHAFQPRHVLGV